MAFRTTGKQLIAALGVGAALVMAPPVALADADPTPNPPTPTPPKPVLRLGLSLSSTTANPGEWLTARISVRTDQTPAADARLLLSTGRLKVTPSTTELKEVNAKERTLSAVVTIPKNVSPGSDTLLAELSAPGATGATARATITVKAPPTKSPTPTPSHSTTPPSSTAPTPGSTPSGGNVPSVPQTTPPGALPSVQSPQVAPSQVALPPIASPQIAPSSSPVGQTSLRSSTTSTEDRDLVSVTAGWLAALFTAQWLLLTRARLGRRRRNGARPRKGGTGQRKMRLALLPSRTPNTPAAK